MDAAPVTPGSNPGTRSGAIWSSCCASASVWTTTLQVDHAPDELLAIGDGTK